jgi:hypothetical protein
MKLRKIEGLGWVFYLGRFLWEFSAEKEFQQMCEYEVVKD